MPYASLFSSRARTLLAVPLVIALLVFGIGVERPTAQAVASTTRITDSAGTAVTTFSIGQSLYITVTDADQNTDTTTKQKINAVLTTSGGDSEELNQAVTQLEETGVNTGIFRNPGYPTALSDGTVTANDGTLEIGTSDSITATYTDNLSSETTTFDFSDSPLNHVAREAAHIDDGSGADDPSTGSCADVEAYSGTEAGYDPNTATNGGYLPVSRSDWDIQPGSTSSNGGPTTSNISADDNTREKNESIKDSVGCHGWDIHEFEMDLSPLNSSTVSSINIDWAGASSYMTVESQAMNDIFLLVYNRTSSQWEKLDTEANINVTEGGAVTDVPLTGTLSANISDYLSSTNVLRIVVAAYDRAADSIGGALYTDYISVQASGSDTSSDTIEIGGGSIFGTVYNDADRDGVFDSGEKGISGVSVTLLDNGSTALVTDTTDSNGDYGFIGFPADTYRLRETDPSGYTSTTSNDLGPLTLASGQVITGQDFGDAQQLSTTGLKSGYVWATFAGVVGMGVLLWAGFARVLAPARTNNRLTRK